MKLLVERRARVGERPERGERARLVSEQLLPAPAVSPKKRSPMANEARDVGKGHGERVTLPTPTLAFALYG